MDARLVTCATLATILAAVIAILGLFRDFFNITAGEAPTVVATTIVYATPIPQPDRPTTTPSPRPTNTLYPTLPATVAGLPEAIVSEQGLNLRQGPGADYKSLGVYPSGSPLKIVGRTQNSEWLLVETEDGKMGWMNRRYIELNRSIDAISVVEQAETALPIPPNPADIPAHNSFDGIWSGAIPTKMSIIFFVNNGRIVNFALTIAGAEGCDRIFTMSRLGAITETGNLEVISPSSEAERARKGWVIMTGTFDTPTTAFGKIVYHYPEDQSQCGNVEFEWSAAGLTGPLTLEFPTPESDS